jgi:thioredoxin reductase
LDTRFDAVIIGGGPAGLAAAQVLGRQRRRVALADNHQYRNAMASSVHMLLGREGMTPSELVLAGQQVLRKLPTVSVLREEVVTVVADGSILLAETVTGLEIAARNLILATGLVDQLPPIPGIDTVYGRSLFHCPLCDGFEARDQRLVIIGGSERAAFMASYVHDRLSETVDICCDGQATFSPGTRRKLHHTNVRIIEAQVRGIHIEHDMLTLEMDDAGSASYHAGFLPIGYRQRSPLAERLGCATGDDGRVQVDQFQRTSIPHVFAVGDMARGTPAGGSMTFAATAIASGLTAAAFLDEDIFARSWDSLDG